MEKCGVFLVLPVHYSLGGLAAQQCTSAGSLDFCALGERRRREPSRLLEKRRVRFCVSCSGKVSCSLGGYWKVGMFLVIFPERQHLFSDLLCRFLYVYDVSLAFSQQKPALHIVPCLFMTWRLFCLRWNYFFSGMPLLVKSLQTSLSSEVLNDLTVSQSSGICSCFRAQYTNSSCIWSKLLDVDVLHTGTQ